MVILTLCDATIFFSKKDKNAVPLMEPEATAYKKHPN
jgi:hypothetical protein